MGTVILTTIVRKSRGNGAINGTRKQELEKWSRNLKLVVQDSNRLQQEATSALINNQFGSF
jgi:hypothetical protein